MNLNLSFKAIISIVVLFLLAWVGMKHIYTFLCLFLPSRQEQFLVSPL